MLTLLNPLGVDLTETPPAATTVSLPSATATGNVRIELLLATDGSLAYNIVRGTVDWNDGSQPVVYTGTGTLALDVTRSLHAGSYIINVVASDYSVPPEQVSVNFPVKVAVASGIVQGTPIVYGPILPKDAGYPNRQQWDFNTGTDLEIIASSLKMLLSTNKGERLMLPEYGTKLRLILFEFKAPGIVNMCQQEIIDALTKWEPRASLSFLTVENSGDREVTINAIFTSKLNQQQFPLALTFNV